MDVFREGLRDLGYMEGKTSRLSGDSPMENAIAWQRLRPSL
jgi:hypothetical protein